MGVYNGAAHVAEAIASILTQTYGDFEFIIVNDGSTDETRTILERFDDPRIKLFHEENAGLTNSLNKAIGRSTGRYIARIDADEVAVPERLCKQVSFLEANPDTALVGSYCCNSDEIDGHESTVVVPVEHENIVRRLRFVNTFVHGSVMIRRSSLDCIGWYDEHFKYVQDWELWARIASRFRVHNLPEVLLRRRIVPGSISNNLDLLKVRARTGMKAQRYVLRHLNTPWYLYGLLWWKVLVFMLYRLGVIRVPIRGRVDLVHILLGGVNDSRYEKLRPRHP